MSWKWPLTWSGPRDQTSRIAAIPEGSVWLSHHHAPLAWRFPRNSGKSKILVQWYCIKRPLVIWSPSSGGLWRHVKFRKYYFVKREPCTLKCGRMSEVHILMTRRAATQIARFMWPTWGPLGDDRTQVGPVLTPWTLRSGEISWRALAVPQTICLVLPCYGYRMISKNAFETFNSQNDSKKACLIM